MTAVPLRVNLLGVNPAGSNVPEGFLVRRTASGLGVASDAHRAAEHSAGVIPSPLRRERDLSERFLAALGMTMVEHNYDKKAVGSNGSPVCRLGSACYTLPPMPQPSRGMSDLVFLSAAELTESIRRKQVSPVEVVEAHLAQIDRLNPQLNAIVSLDREGALAAAHRAEAAVMRGDSLGPLHGVPVTIKSSIDAAGLRCEAGTKLRAGYVPAGDAPLVARLKAAGAIVLGSTNVPELLMAWETDNALYGRTNNPWDLARTPGGSSGGEAAAIAAGCSVAGVGSDGGGSIRVPAHFSGIWPHPGYRPFPALSWTVRAARGSGTDGANCARPEDPVRGHGRS